MSRPVWWTCGCGKRQVSRGAGRPDCVACGKPAQFAIDAPPGQEGLAFAPGSIPGDVDAEGNLPRIPVRPEDVLHVPTVFGVDRFCRGDEDPDR